MIEQLITSKKNILAIEVIDGFSITDEILCQKFFQQKLDEGFEQVNILVKLNEMKMTNTNTKAFFEDVIWTLRNYKKLGHLAIIAHSNIVNVSVSINQLFFERASEGRYERYFDVSQIEEAFEFVNQTGSKQD